jgi:addiction module HigA family antidote
MTLLNAIHPGRILQEAFLNQLGISCYRLAKDINVPVNRITSIVKGKRAITTETGLLLARYFNMPDEFWCKLQVVYDLHRVRETLQQKLENTPVVNYAAQMLVSQNIVFELV